MLYHKLSPWSITIKTKTLKSDSNDIVPLRKSKQITPAVVTIWDTQGWYTRDYMCNCTHISESWVAVGVRVVGLEDFYLSIHKHALCHAVAALKYIIHQTTVQIIIHQRNTKYRDTEIQYSLFNTRYIKFIIYSISFSSFKNSPISIVQ